MATPTSTQPWLDARPTPADYDAFLTAVRILQPAAILLIALISVLLGPSKVFLAHIRSPRRSEYEQLRAEADREDDGERDEPPQPTPVIVPVRSRRRFLTQATQLCLAGSFFISGVLIILRAVIHHKHGNLISFFGELSTFKPLVVCSDGVPSSLPPCGRRRSVEEASMAEESLAGLPSQVPLPILPCWCFTCSP